MESTLSKYIRLFGTLFFTFIGFILALALLLIGIKFFFGLLSYISWINYLYMILILMFPSSLFISVYIIYFRRTAAHPSKIIKLISYMIFSTALICWGVFFAMDLQIFFKYFYNSIDMYHTYNLLFLSCNVGAIFFVGIIQALTTVKEKDWLEKASIKHL